VIGTLSDPRRLAAGTPDARLARLARAVRRPTCSRARARAATTDRATPAAPCLGLALVAGAALWAALGGMVSLLVG
jgi:hypothetical protein